MIKSYFNDITKYLSHAHLHTHTRTLIRGGQYASHNISVCGVRDGHTC